MTPWDVIEEALAYKKRTPVWLAQQLNEKIQTVSNWKLKGRRVPPARYREIANALNITIEQLEGLERLPWQRVPEDSDWPFSSELHQKVLVLSARELSRAENVLRAMFDMPVQNLSAVTNKAQLIHSKPAPDGHTGPQEEGAGVPPDMQPPEPRKHGRDSTHQRPSRRKGGGRS